MIQFSIVANLPTVERHRLDAVPFFAVVGQSGEASKDAVVIRQ
jgi:hypothetical protein